MFKLFRKNKEQTESFDKGFKVAGYTPVDYSDTKRWIDFQDEAEDKFNSIISKLDLDDLCYEVIDAYIEAEAKRNLMHLKKQYTKHVFSIYHNTGILDGNFEHAGFHLHKLESDRNKLECEIESLQEKLN